MKMNHSVYIFLFLFYNTSLILAQSPRNLNSDIAPMFDFIGSITVTQIEANFNNARRQEEVEMGLPANTIKDLDLPDATWNNYSYDQKMLFLLNDERTARAGVNYGDGPCLGLPFEGVESNVDQIAQSYAQYLIDNDTFGHDLNGVFMLKLDNDPAIGGTGCNDMSQGPVANCCHENLPTGENLAEGSSSDNNVNAPVEDAVYGWNYVDSKMDWGHREMNLLQDDNLPWSPGNKMGFLDDYGDAGKAGLIGVGVAETSTNGGQEPFRKVVVLNYFDPAPNCNFNLLVDTDDLGGNGNNCTITAISVGVQTPCNAADNTYTQEITVTFNNAPGTGTLMINGQPFAIGTSPQMVTLTGLPANGQAVNLTANFSDQTDCTFTQNNAFTAPQACGMGCSMTAIAAGNQSPCDQNTNTYSQTLTITYSNAPNSGNLTVNGQTFAIGTSPQTVTLTGLISNGQMVNVTAHFSDQPACTFTQNSAFTAPTACSGGNCNAIAINCGQTYMGNTNNGTNNFNSYSCENWDESGKEIIYQITTTATGDISATVSNDNEGDLDVFILSTCNNMACLAAADQTATAQNQPAGTYLIVVDGYQGAASSYSLIVNANCGGGINCNNPPPAMGVINSGTYQLNGDLTSAGTIPNPNQVVFKASNSINLGANFEVAIGATFEAYIDACNQVTNQTKTGSDSGFSNPGYQDLINFVQNFSTGKSTIVYETTEPGHVQIHLTDLRGKKILQVVDAKIITPGSYQVDFNSNALSEGIYLVNMRTNKSAQSKRFSFINY